jgi:hypothetical protein
MSVVKLVFSLAFSCLANNIRCDAVAETDAAYLLDLRSKERRPDSRLDNEYSPSSNEDRAEASFREGKSLTDIGTAVLPLELLESPDEKRDMAPPTAPPAILVVACRCAMVVW